MTFKLTFVIIGLIFAVAGWFLLGIMLVGRVGIVEFLQSATLTWSFRILIIAVPIILVIKREWLARALEDRMYKIIIYAFYGIGFIGWLWVITDLLV